jgi:hypothetical protein
MPIVGRRSGANFQFQEEGSNLTAAGVTLQLTPSGIIIGNASDEMVAQLLDNQKITLGTGTGVAGDAHIYHDGTNLLGPNPATGMWADLPALAYADPSVAIFYFDDFLSLPIDDTTANPVGWTYTGDANGDATLKTGEFGGVLNVQTGATDNNETTLQLGTGSTGTMFEITDSSGKKVWFEVRVKALQHADEAVFVGLAEEGLGANFLTDDTGVPADKDYVGFRYKTDASAAWDVAWKKEGQTEQELALVVANADDWHTFGFKFDGASAVTFYIDGTAHGTAMDTSAATSPSGEELAPILAIKTGSGATVQMDIDWIKCVMLR